MQTYNPFGSEKKKALPVLIIDKQGLFGNSLAKLLHTSVLTVLVSPREEREQNIVHIPYKNRIPVIPDSAFSHIFVFYNGEKDVLVCLDSFIKKAEESHGKCYLITGIHIASEQLLIKIAKEFPYASLLLYGDLFGENVSLSGSVNRLIHQAISTGQIILPRSGLDPVFPTHVDDMVQGIQKAGWEFGATGNIFFLFPASPLTLLSIARILQKKHSMLKIDFEKKEHEKEPTIFLPQQGIPVISDPYPLTEKIHKLEGTSLSKNIPAEILPSWDRKEKRVPFRLLFFLLFLLIFGPGILTGFLSFLGFFLLQQAKEDIAKGNIVAALHETRLSANSFASAQQSFGPVLFFSSIIGQERFLTGIAKQMSIAEQLADEGTLLFSAYQPISSVINGTSLDPKTDFQTGLDGLKNAVIGLQRLSIEGAIPSSLIDTEKQYNNTIHLFATTADILPVLLGFTGQKEYLVLFQNNMELRPGGGFIGSYGLLKLQNGQEKDFSVHDVYDADGQLKGHVDPPAALQQYLGVKHWFLRDSNFDPDFVNDSQKAAYFLYLETGEKVDGVIAIDTTFLQNILRVTGPIFVPDYHEQVNADNFYLLTENHAEDNFSPGSTQKKDFLHAFSIALFEHLREKKQQDVGSLLRVATDAISQKHILFSFPDQQLQQLFTINGLSSSLTDMRETAENTLADYLGVSEANLGVNKANYYIERTIRQEVGIDAKGNSLSRVTLSYTNTSTATSQFGGDYKNYLRFILPINTVLQSIEIDGQVQTIINNTNAAVGGRTIPAGTLQVDRTEEVGKAIIGLFITVPMQQKRQIAIDYTIPNAIDPNSPTFSYDSFVLKQPGTNADPFSFSLSYPDSYQLVQKNSFAQDIDGKVLTLTNLTTDLHLHMDFSKR